MRHRKWDLCSSLRRKRRGPGGHGRRARIAIARCFDVDGRPGGAIFDQRAIGVTLGDLRACPVVVAVASGQHTAPGILGALRGGDVTVLITDDATTEDVLRLAGAALPLVAASADCQGVPRDRG